MVIPSMKYYQTLYSVSMFDNDIKPSTIVKYVSYNKKPNVL